MDCQKGYLKKEENCNLSRNFLWDEIEKDANIMIIEVIWDYVYVKILDVKL